MGRKGSGKAAGKYFPVPKGSPLANVPVRCKTGLYDPGPPKWLPYGD